MELYSTSELDAILQIDVLETGAYGNNFEGASSSDGVVTFEFDSDGSGLFLDLVAYDIDSDDEIGVSLNGEFIGYLDEGVDHGLSNDSLQLHSNLVLDGTNVLEFFQEENPAWRWGVTDILLTSAEQLTIGEVNSGVFGNGVNGITDADGSVEFEFESDCTDLFLNFDAYDSDYEGEIVILLNGEEIALVEQGGQNAFSSHSIEIDADALQDGTNVLEFYRDNDPTKIWGVSDILLTPQNLLKIDAYNMGTFGNRFDGNNDTSGEVTFQFEVEGRVSDVTLYADGYDIDFVNEVQVYVNGQSIGFMQVQEDGVDNDLVMSSFDISAELLVSGTNSVTFVQNIDANRFSWGVTQVLILGPGPHEFPAGFDPEFMEDYVIWQDDNTFTLGRIDLDTGVYLGALNVSYISPLEEYIINGPELMMTTDGIVGIGTSGDGIVVITPTEDYLIEGTEGLSLGELPNGIVDGIRFNAITFDWSQNYIIDNGVITEIDLNGGALVSWLNDYEATVSYVRAGIELYAVYNIETGELTELIDNAYSDYPTKQDAFTTPDGEQLIAISNGITHDLWSNTGDGWEVIHVIRSPYEDLKFLMGIQFIQWEGRTWIAGILGETPSSALTIPFLYDLENNAWSVVKTPDTHLDQEVVFLNNGDLALHYFNIRKQQQEFFTITYDDVMEAQIPGVSGNPGPGRSISSDTSEFASITYTAPESSYAELPPIAPTTASVQKVVQPERDDIAMAGTDDAVDEESVADNDSFDFLLGTGTGDGEIGSSTGWASA